MKNLLTILFGNVAHAQNLIDCPDGTQADVSIGCVSTPGSVVNSETNISELILKLASGLLSAAIAIAVIFMIYGGIQYAIAAGDEDKIQKAKRTLIWSVIGLVIALLARIGVGAIVSSL